MSLIKGRAQRPALDDQTEEEVREALDAYYSRRTIRYIFAVGVLVSVLAYLYFDANGAVLAYADSISHLEIARRVIDGPTKGLAQLGAVWLPLPHLLELPLIWIPALYFSGFAGIAISMISFVLTSVLLYKMTYRLTSSKVAGVVASGVFMFNPNILYMQSTPMTELLLFACIAGMFYCLQSWIQTDRVGYLYGAGVASMAGILTRYEAWWLSIVAGLVVIWTCYRKRYGYKRSEGTVLAFALFPGITVALWMIWNGFIFGNPLYFQVGEYAKPSLWVKAGELPVGNLPIAFATYSIAVYDDLFAGIMILAVIGLIFMFVRQRVSLPTLPTLSMLTIFPFFVITLFQGQRPLHVEQIAGNLYNVRFGLLMVLPAAVLTGYFVSVFHKKQAKNAAAIVAGIATVATAVFGLSSFSNTATVREYAPVLEIATLKEPSVALIRGYELALGASKYLQANYHGGRILAESFGNELVLFKAGITPTQNVYEGSYRQWDAALKYPKQNKIEWIIMRHINAKDKVFRALNGKPAMVDYTRVYSSEGYYIYKLKEAS